jgi:hypothetical protein
VAPFGKRRKESGVDFLPGALPLIPAAVPNLSRELAGSLEAKLSRYLQIL